MSRGRPVTRDSFDYFCRSQRYRLDAKLTRHVRRVEQARAPDDDDCIVETYPLRLSRRARVGVLQSELDEAEKEGGQK
jgi:hypothetical protein